MLVAFLWGQNTVINWLKGFCVMVYLVVTWPSVGWKTRWWRGTSWMSCGRASVSS